MRVLNGSGAVARQPIVPRLRPAEIAAYVDAVMFLKSQAATCASMLRNPDIPTLPLTARVKLADLLDAAVAPFDVED